MPGQTTAQNPLSPSAPYSVNPENNKQVKEKVVQTGIDSKYEVTLIQSTKEAENPTQETQDPKKSLYSSKDEERDKRPLQGLMNPKNSISGTPTVGNKSLQLFEESSKGKPVQESEGLDHPEGSTRFVVKPLKETEDPFFKETEVETEEQNDETGEVPFKEEGFEFNKEKPIQETQVPGKAQDVDQEDTREVNEDKKVQQQFGKGKPLQESGRSKVETESYKEEALPIQETMAAGKGPFEETGLEVGVKTQPTDEK